MGTFRDRGSDQGIVDGGDAGTMGSAKDAATRGSGGRAPEVTVVVPAYKERRLAENVGDLRAALSDLDHEVVLVTDHPGEVTARIAAEMSGGSVRHVALDEAVGKGGAVLRGFEEARGEVAGFVDADGAVAPDDVRRVVEAARRSGGAIASRMEESSEVVRDRSVPRRLASRAFNVYVRVLFGLPYRDTQCGAKFFRREPLLAVARQMRSTGFEFDVELLWRLRSRGVRIEEVPVRWEHAEESGFSLAEGPGMLFNLLRLRLSERP